MLALCHAWLIFIGGTAHYSLLFLGKSAGSLTLCLRRSLIILIRDAKTGSRLNFLTAKAVGVAR